MNHQSKIGGTTYEKWVLPPISCCGDNSHFGSRLISPSFINADMRILIVDDNAAMCSFLSTIVQDLHHDTCESANGADAVVRFQHFRPGLVLMDICMPGMDGIEATERIREMDPSATVVMVTEHDEKLYRETAKQAGAADYFLKENLIALQAYVETTNATRHE